MKLIPTDGAGSRCPWMDGAQCLGDQCGPWSTPGEPAPCPMIPRQVETEVAVKKRELVDKVCALCGVMPDWSTVTPKPDMKMSDIKVQCKCSEWTYDDNDQLVGGPLPVGGE